MIRTSKFIVLALTSALAVAGCDRAPESGAVEEAEQALEPGDAPEQAAPNEGAPAQKRGPEGRAAREGAKGHPRGGHGPERLLHAALRELTLTGAQRQAIQGALDGLDDALPEPPKALAKKLAEQVRAGQIDERALSPELAALEKGRGARHAEVAKAIQTLHDTLTHAQRAELVASVLEHAERGPMGRKGMGPMGAGKGGEHPHRGPLGHLLRGLDLTDEQQAKVDEALRANAPAPPDFAGHEAKRKAALEAFEADVFDATKAMPEPPDGHPLGHMVSAAAALVPVLDAKQRAALADALEQGPRHFGGPGKLHGRHGRSAD